MRVVVNLLIRAKDALSFKHKQNPRWMTKERVHEKFVEAFPAARERFHGEPPKCGTCGKPLIWSPAGTWYCISASCMEIMPDDPMEDDEDYFEGLEEMTDEQQRIHKLEVAVARLEGAVKGLSP